MSHGRQQAGGWGKDQNAKGQVLHVAAQLQVLRGVVKCVWLSVREQTGLHKPVLLSYMGQQCVCSLCTTCGCDAHDEWLLDA